MNGSVAPALRLARGRFDRPSSKGSPQFPRLVACPNLLTGGLIDALAQARVRSGDRAPIGLLGWRTAPAGHRCGRRAGRRRCKRTTDTLVDPVGAHCCEVAIGRAYHGTGAKADTSTDAEADAETHASPDAEAHG